jgi:hypothetical protein
MSESDLGGMKLFLIGGETWKTVSRLRWSLCARFCLRPINQKDTRARGTYIRYLQRDDEDDATTVNDVADVKEGFLSNSFMDADVDSRSVKQKSFGRNSFSRNDSTQSYVVETQ